MKHKHKQNFYERKGERKALTFTGVIFSLIVLSIFLFPMISAEKFGYNYLTPGDSLQTTINYSILSVNDSLLWDGNAWDINRWLLTDGSNSPIANINWNGFDIDFFGGNIDNITHIQFNLLGNGCVDEGCLEWNPIDGTLDLTMPGGSVNQQIGLENLRRVKANETITNGDVVYPCGGIANRLLICKADYGNIATAGINGIATEDITKDQFGYINAFGYVRDIDTTGALGYCSEGLPAWLSSDGTFQCIPPSGNKIRTVVGVIVNAHATDGIIDTHIQLVPRLQGLSQVNGTGITDDSIFVYNATSGIWDNKLRYDFTGLNVTADYHCLNTDCSSYFHNNGTHTIWK